MPFYGHFVYTYFLPPAFQVDALTSGDVCSNLNIDEPSKLNSPEVTHDNNLDIAGDFLRDEENKNNESMDNKSIASSAEINEKHNEVQATLTTELVRDNIVEIGDVMFVEKHERNVMMTTKVIKLSSTDPILSTAKSYIQQNSSSNNILPTLQTTTAAAAQNLNTSLWIRNVLFT